MTTRITGNSTPVRVETEAAVVLQPLASQQPATKPRVAPERETPPLPQQSTRGAATTKALPGLEQAEAGQRTKEEVLSETALRGAVQIAKRGEPMPADFYKTVPELPKTHRTVAKQAYADATAKGATNAEAVHTATAEVWKLVVKDTVRDSEPSPLAKLGERPGGLSELTPNVSAAEAGKKAAQVSLTVSSKPDAKLIKEHQTLVEQKQVADTNLIAAKHTADIATAVANKQYDELAAMKAELDDMLKQMKDYKSFGPLLGATIQSDQDYMKMYNKYEAMAGTYSQKIGEYNELKDYANETVAAYKTAKAEAQTAAEALAAFEKAHPECV